MRRLLIGFGVLGGLALALSVTMLAFQSLKIPLKPTDNTYLAPDKTFKELREMLADGSIDILGKFGDVCRAEFESLRAQQF